jgi:CheY-like chemotaxis protein
MHMPEMDGVQLAREIQNLEKNHSERSHEGTQSKNLNRGSLPLVLFSSLGRRETGVDDALFAAYLTKPIKTSALFDTLVNLLAKDEPSARPTPAKAQLDPTMAERVPLRILLAEDNAVNQKLALRILSQMGYRADVAGNGIEAIEAVERQKYDLIFMDVQMPEMDGLEATRQIVKRWERTARPRIVAMTANATQGDREMCLAAGMDDYIAKPILVDELIGALERTSRSPQPPLVRGE